jgi:hypothetical protein
VIALGWDAATLFSGRACFAPFGENAAAEAAERTDGADHRWASVEIAPVPPTPFGELVAPRRPESRKSGGSLCGDGHPEPS